MSNTIVVTIIAIVALVVGLGLSFLAGFGVGACVGVFTMEEAANQTIATLHDEVNGILEDVTLPDEYMSVLEDARVKIDAVFSSVEATEPAEHREVE